MYCGIVAPTITQFLRLPDTGKLMATNTLQRSSGLLIHIASLPSRYGIGDFGNEARAFVDFLASAGQKLWQVLPLSPTGYGNSPYSSYSAFAYNPLFISPDLLQRDSYLPDTAFSAIPEFSADRVDYAAVSAFKEKLFTEAFRTFLGTGSGRDAYAQFCTERQHWLDDYALFMALKGHFAGKPWNEWDEPIKLRTAEALAHYRSELAQYVELHKFLQFVCDRQWRELKNYANGKGVSVIGDIPIFLAYDSADVWANRGLFRLHDDGSPVVVTGVPPDYFSETGQLWGNPHYNWPAMQQTDFEWWKQRFARMFELYNVVRIDHFRGFEASYEVKAGAPDARKGRWKKVPGSRLFSSLLRHFGALPVLAEDLGMITEEVHVLRRRFHFPGMRVLQFGYGSGEPHNDFLPHNFERDSVVYTGTHDNDTTAGWYATLPEDKQRFVHEYLHVSSVEEVCEKLIQEACASVALYAIIPVQDILALGSEARMNFPGKPDGNWEFRLPPGALTQDHANRLHFLAYLYNRS